MMPEFANTEIIAGPDAVLIDQSAKHVDPQQRSARQWLAELDSNDPRKRGAAIVALQKLGADGIPSLGQAINHESLTIRSLAARALGELAQEHDEALAILEEAIQDQELTKISFAIDGLAMAGERGIPILVGLLDRPDKNTRLAVLLAFQSMGPKAGPATPAVAALLKSPDEATRLQAAHLLGKIGPAAAAAVDDLLEAAQGDEDKLAALAIVSLGAVGGEPEKTVPLMMTILRGDPQLGSARGRAASDALATMGGPAVQPLAAELSNPASPIRAAAVGTLRKMGAPALPVLLPIVRGATDTAIRYQAISAMGDMKAAAAEAVPDLARLLEEGADENCQVAAVLALGAIGPDARPAIPAILNRISRRPQAASFETRALLQIGGADASALEVLSQCLAQGEIGECRELAADAIGEFCGSSEPAVQVLSTTLQTDTSRLVRQHAAKALAKLAVSMPSARTVLEQARNSEDYETRTAAQSVR